MREEKIAQALVAAHKRGGSASVAWGNFLTANLERRFVDSDGSQQTLLSFTLKNLPIGFFLYPLSLKKLSEITKRKKEVKEKLFNDEGNQKEFLKAIKKKIERASKNEVANFKYEILIEVFKKFSDPESSKSLKNLNKLSLFSRELISLGKDSSFREEIEDIVNAFGKEGCKYSLVGLSFAGKDFFEEALSVCEEKFFLSEDVEINVWRKLCRMMILWPEAESIHWSMEKFFEGRENLLRDYNFFLQSCDEHDYPIIGTDVIQKVLSSCLKLECFKGLKEDLCQKDWREIDIGLPPVNEYLEGRFECSGRASALDFVILSELAADFHEGMLSRNIIIYDFYSTSKVLFADILEFLYKKGQFIKDVRLAGGLTVDVSKEKLSHRGLDLVDALIGKLSFPEQKGLAEEFFAVVEGAFLKGLDGGEKDFHKSRLVKV